MGRRRMPGEGSVYRRKSDGRWVAQLSHGPRGSRSVLTAYRHSRSEAKAALDELRSRGRVRSTMTVSDFLGSWLRDVRDIRPNTRHGYAAVVNTHLAPTIGAVRLVELSPLHVEAMLKALEPTMAPKTLRNVHVVLRRALVAAVRSELVSRNVAAREYVDAPRVAIVEPPSLTEREIAHVLAVLPGSPIEAHVMVGLGTGLRQGEQLGLAWEDVEGTTLYVRQALVRSADGVFRRDRPKTDRSLRAVPLAPPVVEALEAHRGRIIAAGFVPTSTGPVFINGVGAAMSGSVLTHRWYELLESAGVNRKPWKILRATFASRLHAAGVADRTIADLLGHSRTATTQRHYITSAGADAAVDAIAKTLDSHADSHGSQDAVAQRGVRRA